MNRLKDYVNWKLTHSDKTSEAEGYPLTLENCKKNKKMKQLDVYGNSVQDGTPTPDNPIELESVGELITDVNDANYGKYKIPVVQRSVNLFCISKHSATTQTINGITFTPLGDERIHIKGKLEDTTKPANYRAYYKTKTYIKSGTYKAKPCKYSKNGVTIQFNLSNGSSSVNVSANDASNTFVFNNAYINFVQIYISGTTVEFDDIIELQLMKGTENLPYEPYVEPITTNIFLNEPLRKIGDYADYVDFKSKKAIHYSAGVATEETVNVDLPKLNAKTTIIEVDTSLAPSNIYGKYIKR